MGAAASALGENDFRDIEEWIDACDVMDFFTDELNGGFFWNEGDVDSFCGDDFFANGFVAWCSFIKTATVVATCPTALATVIATVALASIALVAVVTAATVVSVTRCKIAFLGFAEFLFRVCGFGARPCWTECKLVEKAF